MSKVQMKNKFTYWIYDITEETVSRTKLDVYVCAECGYRHKVLHDKKPIMPFCWQCKKIVRES